MKPAEAAAQNRKSVWPLIIVGVTAGATWSWFDPDAADRAAGESLLLLQLLTQHGLDFAHQRLDIVLENMKQLLANNSI